jgi:hypothetical protein
VVSVGQEPAGRGAPVDRARRPVAALPPDPQLLASWRSRLTFWRVYLLHFVPPHPARVGTMQRRSAGVGGRLWRAVPRPASARPRRGLVVLAVPVALPEPCQRRWRPPVGAAQQPHGGGHHHQHARSGQHPAATAKQQPAKRFQHHTTPSRPGHRYPDRRRHPPAPDHPRSPTSPSPTGGSRRTASLASGSGPATVCHLPGVQCRCTVVQPSQNPGDRSARTSWPRCRCAAMTGRGVPSSAPSAASRSQLPSAPARVGRPGHQPPTRGEPSAVATGVVNEHHVEAVTTLRAVRKPKLPVGDVT